MEKKSETKELIFPLAIVGSCLVPEQDEWVYDYYNMQLTEKQEQEFEDHIFECDRCQDVLLMLDWAYTEMRANAHKYVSPKEDKARMKYVLAMRAIR